MLYLYRSYCLKEGGIWLKGVGWGSVWHLTNRGASGGVGNKFLGNLMETNPRGNYAKLGNGQNHQQL